MKIRQWELISRDLILRGVYRLFQVQRAIYRATAELCKLIVVIRIITIYINVITYE